MDKKCNVCNELKLLISPISNRSGRNANAPSDSFFIQNLIHLPNRVNSFTDENQRKPQIEPPFKIIWRHSPPKLIE
jgi:hypothetical protein